MAGLWPSTAKIDLGVAKTAVLLVYTIADTSYLRTAGS